MVSTILINVEASIQVLRIEFQNPIHKKMWGEDSITFKTVLEKGFIFHFQHHDAGTRFENNLTFFNRIKPQKIMGYVKNLLYEL